MKSKTLETSLNYPENKTSYIDWSMKWWNKHVTKYSINSVEDFDYWIMLVKQVLKKFFN